MLAKLIDRLLELAPVGIHEPIEGMKFSDRKIEPVRPHKMPRQELFKVNTISGLCEWLLSSDGDEARKSCVVHVVDHKTINVFSSPDPYYRERHSYIQAEATVDVFPFGKFMSIEEFVIKTSSLFVMTDNLQSMLKVVSSISSTDTLTVEDDGISQKVSIQNEVRRIAKVEISPFQQLRPNRTFAEVEQPESRFLLRMRAKGVAAGELPTVALFEADNAAWKIEAMGSIQQMIFSMLIDNEPVDGHHGINVIM